MIKKKKEYIDEKQQEDKRQIEETKRLLDDLARAQISQEPQFGRYSSSDNNTCVVEDLFANKSKQPSMSK